MHSHPHHLQCLEVWGGNGAAAHAVSMPGLDVAVFARPHGATGAGPGGSAVGADGNGLREAEGGDVHYVSSCGTGRISRILVADVAGHGPKVGSLARALRDLMRRHVNTVNQAGFVERMNSEFTTAAADSGGRFATAVVATYWAPTSYFVACNAGHPQPIAFCKRTGKWTILTGMHEGTFRAGGEGGAGSPGDTGMALQADGGGGDKPNNLPLGIIGDTRYSQFAVKLAVGDLVVLYTDALLEGKTADGQMLGEAGLVECLATLPTNDFGALPRLLFEAVLAKCGEPDDDVTIMVLASRTGPAQAPFVARAWGGVRFLGLLAAAALARVGIGKKDGAVVPWPEASAENIAGSMVPAFGLRLGRRAKGLHELR